MGGPQLQLHGGRGDVPDALHARLLLLPLPPHPLRRRRPLLAHLLQAQAQVRQGLARQFMGESKYKSSVKG